MREVLSKGPEIIEVSLDGVVDACLAWHSEFDKKIWSGKKSFHNAKHVGATITVGEKLIKAALAGNDPLGIMDDLTIWNEQHMDNQIKKEELLEIIKFTLAGHDLGNIAERFTVGKAGLIPVFHNMYRAKEAEERSKLMEQQLIEYYLPGMNRFLPLVTHLINETKYDFEDGIKPFSVLMRVIDQIGNAILNPDNVDGLNLENEAEGRNVPSAYSSESFIEYRFKMLVKDLITRQEVDKILRLDCENTQNIFQAGL